MVESDYSILYPLRSSRYTCRVKLVTRVGTTNSVEMKV